MIALFKLSPEENASYTMKRIFKLVNAANLRFDIAEQYFTMVFLKKKVPSIFFHGLFQDEINDDFLDHCEEWRHKPRMLSLSKRWGSPQNPIYHERFGLKKVVY